MLAVVSQLSQMNRPLQTTLSTSSHEEIPLSLSLDSHNKLTHGTRARRRFQRFHKRYLLVIVVPFICTIFTLVYRLKSETVIDKDFLSTVALSSDSFSSTTTTIQSSPPASIDVATSSSTPISYSTLRQSLPEDNESATASQKRKRVVILAGPHGMDAPDLFETLEQWTTPSSYLLDGWAWPVPPMISSSRTNSKNGQNWKPSRGFDDMVQSFLLSPTAEDLIEDSSSPLLSNHTIHQIQKLYKTEFLRAWFGGYNILLGSEKMYQLVQKQYKSDENKVMSEKLKNMIELFPSITL